MIDLVLQHDYQDERLLIDEDHLLKVITATLNHFNSNKTYEIGIACVDSQHSQQLNTTYRHKDKPTNVLSFPSELPDEILDELDCLPLGDLVICIPVVLKEADEQHKVALEHFTHLVVHGVLHLLGFDHETSLEDAEEMEGIEIEILSKLGIDNPYVERTNDTAHNIQGEATQRGATQGGVL